MKTLISWFPDRPGMATGLAIMGFGGGAMVGSPLAVALMDHFKTPTSMGVAETFAVMGVIYFVFMMWGVSTIRIPAENWKPSRHHGVNDALTKNAASSSKLQVSVQNSVKTPQFYFLWLVLFLNVTAGIGVLGQASAMSQEMFKGTITAAAAAGFVGLLSIFNMAGRFFWSSLSDYTGRRRIYMVYFALGALLYASIPTVGHMQNVVLFVLLYGVIMSMYGAGFATIPAYISDLYGKADVSAIHGRILTAWSAAGIAGPALVNYIREAQIAGGTLPAEAYSFTMYLMAALLVVGFVCNFLIKPVDPKFASANLK